MRTTARAPITTHILDTERGRPVAGVEVTLAKWVGDKFETIKSSATNTDGRVEQWQEPLQVEAGIYQLQFTTANYFAGLGVTSFYPHVVISFEIKNPAEHFHVPLLLSAHGYSTYRGS